MERLVRIARGARRARVAALGLALVVVAGEAWGQVQCGAIIGPKEKVTLQGDLEQCPPGTPALTVVGPATLDLNGFSVICREAGVNTARGIVVVGKRAVVRNGTVQHCSIGVEVLGEGSHRIENVTAALSDDGFGPLGEGFVIESDANRLTGNTAIANDGEGFRLIHADRNRLVRNHAFFFNASSGFVVDVGLRNVLQGNTARDNHIFGFFLGAGPFTPGGGRNVVKNNSATGNQTGFWIDGEEGTRLTGNVADENHGDGILLVRGRKNRLTRNQANGNGENGIALLSESGTHVTRNAALNNDRDNDGNRHYDLNESLTNCGDNRWRNNVFASANQPCVR